MSNANPGRAYEYIRERILGGKFAPGAPLMTSVLSEQIGVSRTPIHDALRQLEAEGLVVIRPRLGASVKTMAVKEFREVCELRLALETHAAGLAAARRTDEDLRQIGHALAAMDELTEKLRRGPETQPLLTDLIREDVRFHIAIISAARNEMLKKEILRLHLVNRIVVGPPPRGPGSSSEETEDKPAHRRAVQAGHKEIFQAIHGGEIAAAKGAMEHHIQDIIDRNVQWMTRAENRNAADELTKEELVYTT